MYKQLWWLLIDSMEKNKTRKEAGEPKDAVVNRVDIDYSLSPRLPP